MDPDEKVRSGRGSEREPLRPILDQWKVPEPPREIEWRLRRTFRQRRAGRRRLRGWFAAAASLALLVLLLNRWWQYGKPPSVVEQAPATPAPIAPSGVAPEPLPLEVPVAAAPRPRVTPRARGSRAAEAEILVEPRQAELLIQLARSLRGTRQAPPGLSMPRIEVVGADAPAVAIPHAEAADVPAYRTEWRTVADPWPPMHLPL